MEREVTLERRGPEGRIRPYDLLIRGWGADGEGIDITMRHATATFDSPGAMDRVTDAAVEKHDHYDGPCRRANLPVRVFGLSTFGGASAEAMGIVGTLRSRLVEKFGKRGGQALAQQAMERIAVAAMRGVAANGMDDGGRHFGCDHPYGPRDGRQLTGRRAAERPAVG